MLYSMITIMIMILILLIFKNFNNPLLMILIINNFIMFTSLSMYMYTQSIYSFILFLIFIGAMMIIIMYLTSISNWKNPSIYNKWKSNLMYLSSLITLYTMFFFIFFYHLPNNIEIKLNYNLFTLNKNLSILFIIMFLMLMLMIMIKMCNKSNKSFRQSLL